MTERRLLTAFFVAVACVAISEMFGSLVLRSVGVPLLLVAASAIFYRAIQTRDQRAIRVALVGGLLSLLAITLSAPLGIVTAAGALAFARNVTGAGATGIAWLKALGVGLLAVVVLYVLALIALGGTDF